MPNFKLSFEIEIEAETALDAANEVQDWLDQADTKWAFHVQNDETKEIVLVDLAEDESVAVTKVENYQPLIQ